MPDIEFIAGPMNQRAFVQLGDLEDRTRRGIRRFWFFLGKTLVKSFNTSVLKKPRSGRVYTRRIKGGARRRHVASRAGETAANLTGNYRRSIGYKIRGVEEMTFGNRAEYAGFLENGTSRMAARPGLGNAVRESEGEGLSGAADFIEQEIRRL